MVVRVMPSISALHSPRSRRGDEDSRSACAATYRKRTSGARTDISLDHMTVVTTPALVFCSRAVRASRGRWVTTMLTLHCRTSTTSTSSQRNNPNFSIRSMVSRTPHPSGAGAREGAGPGGAGAGAGAGVGAGAGCGGAAACLLLSLTAHCIDASHPLKRPIFSAGLVSWMHGLRALCSSCSPRLGDASLADYREASEPDRGG